MCFSVTADDGVSFDDWLVCFELSYQNTKMVLLQAYRTKIQRQVQGRQAGRRAANENRRGGKSKDRTATNRTELTIGPTNRPTKKTNRISTKPTDRGPDRPTKPTRPTGPFDQTDQPNRPTTGPTDQIDQPTDYSTASTCDPEGVVTCFEKVVEEHCVRDEE